MDKLSLELRTYTLELKARNDPSNIGTLTEQIPLDFEMMQAGSARLHQIRVEQEIT